MYGHGNIAPLRQPGAIGNPPTDWASPASRPGA